MTPSATSSTLAHLSKELPILIAGPTASGKSALAMEIAARDGRVIVNADALQVYDNWRILTARPSENDHASLPHALYGHIEKHRLYSVGEWLREIAPLLSKPVVIVGGTGLYLSALTEGLADIPKIPADIRALADARLATEGLAGFLDEIDTETRAKIDQLNPARLQRAWEVQMATGRGLADWQAQTPAPLIALDACQPLVIRPDPSWLNARISQRFSQMIASGALDEVRANAADWNPALPSAKAIGAPQLIAYLQGFVTLDAAIAQATVASNQYAKRQRTWFRTRMKAWQDWAVS